MYNTSKKSDEDNKSRTTRPHKRRAKRDSAVECNEKKDNKHQRTSRKRDLKKVEVTWNVPNTEGCDFATLIKDYNSLSSTEKLKAKTKYLEQRYGAVSSLEEPTRFAKRLGELLDDHDLNSGITTNVIKEESTGDLTHEDAIFGRQTCVEETGERKNDPVLTEEVVQSQKTTSWRERAAWRRKQRTGKFPQPP